MTEFSAESDEREEFFDTLDLSPVAMLVTDPTLPDNPIRLANHAFCDLTGYPWPEVVGRNCRFLTGPETNPADSLKLGAAVREERSALVEILNYRRDGTAFRNGVMITPLFDADGHLRWFIGSQVDLGDPHIGDLAGRGIWAASLIAELSPRQRDVLRLFSHGLLSKQIAHTLNISIKTVEAHRSQVLQRLGVRTSAEAIRLAIEGGL